MGSNMPSTGSSPPSTATLSAATAATSRSYNHSAHVQSGLRVMRWIGLVRNGAVPLHGPWVSKYTPSEP
jgi:hypothetical protein